MSIITLDPRQIVVHASATEDREGLDVASIYAYHVGVLGYRDIGYHVLIDNINGYEVAVLGRPLTMVGAHTRGQNTTAIGVCFVGDFQKTAPTDAKYEAGAKVIRWLMEEYHIPIDAIWRHDHYNATLCPGPMFDIERLKAVIVGGQA